MPSFSHSVLSVLASGAITVGGAWLASGMYAAGFLPSGSESTQTGLSVTVTDIRNGNGTVVVLVFDDRDAFKTYDASKSVGYKTVPASSGRVVVPFPDLRHGPYAIGAFHDEDENQDLNMNGQVPTEGYATSGATDASDMPTFRRASVPAGPVNITMYYWE